MADLPIDDLNIASNVTLITPERLKNKIPLSEQAQRTVSHGRQVVRDILMAKITVYLLLLAPALSMI